MKPAILNNDHMMFFDRAMEAQRSQLLTVMADAVSECRTAADQAAELSETGQIGLLRLVELKAYCYASQCGWQKHHRTEGSDKNKVQLPDLAIGPTL